MEAENISDGNCSDRLTFFEQLFQEIISKQRCVICLCFYNEKSMIFCHFHEIRTFLTFSLKSEKSALFGEKCTFSLKSQKSALFHENHQKVHFSLFSRPLRECCSSQWNIDGFGSHFLISEQKVHFFVNFMEKCSFLTFQRKSALFTPKCTFLTFSGKVRKVRISWK